MVKCPSGKLAPPAPAFEPSSTPDAFSGGLCQNEKKNKMQVDHLFLFTKKKVKYLSRDFGSHRNY